MTKKVFFFLPLCTFVLAIGLSIPNESLSSTPGSGLPIFAEKQDEMIIVRVKDKTFTCYRFGRGQKYPYFYPVNGPLSGISLTTESDLPYPHHRSLFFGCDQVNDGNFWQEGNERGQIISTGAEIIRNGPTTILLRDTCQWQIPGQAPLLLDHREIRLFAPSDSLRVIDFHITLMALNEIRIAKTNHSLFSARMKSDLSVAQGGILVNAEGLFSEKGTFAASSPWCDYYGRSFDVTEGLAIFDCPQNPWYPSKWFTRDYGFFSPTPMYWLDDSGFKLKKDSDLHMQYRVIVHAGSTEATNIKKLFAEWTEMKPMEETIQEKKE